MKDLTQPEKLARLVIEQCLDGHNVPDSLPISMEILSIFPNVDLTVVKVEKLESAMDFLETAGPKLFAEKVSETNSVADSTGEKTGTPGASKEAGGHSRGGLTPVSTLPKPAPDAVREAHNFLAWLVEDIDSVTAEVGTPRDVQLKEFERKGFLRFKGTWSDTNGYEITNSGAFIPPALSAPVPSPDGAITREALIAFIDEHSGGYNPMRLTLADALLKTFCISGTGAADPGALEKYIPDIVKNAMLTMWNEICADTDCHPLDITHGTGKILWFTPHHWAELTGDMVARNIADLYATPPVRGDRSILADQYADYSAACDKVRREMRALILERDDPKLSSLYYRAVTLSEHEAARRTLLSLAVEREAGVKMGDASTKGDSK